MKIQYYQKEGKENDMDFLKKRKISILVSFFSIIFLMGGCGQKTSGIDEDYYVKGNQEVILDIDYKGNLFIAKDNLDIYVDNHKFYTVSNGERNVNTYDLTKGVHVIKVASSAYHYAAVEFTVENPGDMFSFSIKNHTSKIDLALTEYVNYYEAIGTEIPESIDDMADALSKDQIKAAKTNRTIWSYIWMAIKCIILFIVMAIILLICGIIVKAIFSVLHAEKWGILLELVGICIFSFLDGVTVLSFVIPIIFLGVWCLVSIKIKKIPELYRNFSSILDSVGEIYMMLYSMVFAVACLSFPDLVQLLPFRINYFEWYMYVYLILIVFIVICSLDTELDYPETIRQYVEETGIVTEKEIEEYVDGHLGEDATEDDFQTNIKRMKKTLKELAKINLIEICDDGKSFKSKQVIRNKAEGVNLQKTFCEDLNE